MIAGNASAAGATRARFARSGLSRAQAAGFGWAALSLLIFSGWFVVTRFAVTRELRIADIIALRFGIGAVVLAPAVLRRGSRLPLKAWGRGLGFAILWGAPFALLVALGLELSSAALAASIAPALMPVFAGVLGCVLLRERQGMARWLGYAAIVGGLAGMVAGDGAGPPNAAGMAALILAAAMWAVYTLLFRRSGMVPMQAAAMICIWSAVLFLPPYLLLGLGRFADASGSEIAVQAIYQGVLMSSVALIAFNRAVTLLGPAAATSIIALLPAVATLLAIPVLHEIPPPAECAALAAVVAGALLAAAPVRGAVVS